MHYMDIVFEAIRPRKWAVIERWRKYLGSLPSRSSHRSTSTKAGDSTHLHDSRIGADWKSSSGVIIGKVTSEGNFLRISYVRSLGWVVFRYTKTMHKIESRSARISILYMCRIDRFKNYATMKILKATFEHRPKDICALFPSFVRESFVLFRTRVLSRVL